jgi:hypothetical protein
VVEHDHRFRERTRKVRDVVKLRVKDQGIEREAETAEDRESFPKRLVAEQPRRYRIARIDAVRV